jgi:hypothetical protein
MRLGRAAPTKRHESASVAAGVVADVFRTPNRKKQRRFGVSFMTGV